jgi:hypothetical protein
MLSRTCTTFPAKSKLESSLYRDIIMRRERWVYLLCFTSCGFCSTTQSDAKFNSALYSRVAYWCGPMSWLLLPVSLSVNFALAPNIGLVCFVTSRPFFTSHLDFVVASSVPLFMVRGLPIISVQCSQQIAVLLKRIDGRQRKVSVVASGCWSEQLFFNF